ncbi:hypothetical protein ACU635_59985 [[Actinomadura] parvosata]|uniref:hypothetical protein n=1 Tax=[Actinomadura] parvosata TaxID=1955412 RepID=UPI00406CAA43
MEARSHRAWAVRTLPPFETLLAATTLAAMPRALRTRLTTHLDGGIVVDRAPYRTFRGFEQLGGVPLPV